MRMCRRTQAVLRLAVRTRRLGGGRARAGCEGRARVRAGAGPGRVRAEPGRVRAKPVLGRVVMPRPAVSGAGARVSTRDLRVGVPG